MTHREFQLDTTEGSTNVHFNVDGNGIDVVITTIQIHSNFKSGLPHSAELEWNSEAGKWMLAAYYTKDVNGTATNVREFINTQLSNQIIERIMEIKEEETPTFIK